MRIKSRSSKKNKNSFSIEIPLPLIQKEGSFLSFNFFILNPGSSTFFLISFFSWILDFISNFLLLSHRYTLWIHREPFLLYESILFYYIPIPARYPPKKIPNWIQNWRVSVSLSMRLCTLEIGINFLILAFVLWWIVLDPFDDLCCVEGISIWSDRLRKARGSNGTGESIKNFPFFCQKLFKKSKYWTFSSLWIYIILLHSNFFPIPPKENPQLDPKLTG